MSGMAKAVGVRDRDICEVDDHHAGLSWVGPETLAAGGLPTHPRAALPSIPVGGARMQSCEPMRVVPGMTMNVGTDSVGLIVVSRHHPQAKES